MKTTLFLSTCALLSCLAQGAASQQRSAAWAEKKRRRRRGLLASRRRHRQLNNDPQSSCTFDALLASSCTLAEYCESLHVWKCGEDWKEGCHASYTCSGSVPDHFVVKETDEEECYKNDFGEISTKFGYDLTPDEYNVTTFNDVFDGETMHCSINSHTYTFTGDVARSITWMEEITQPLDAVGILSTTELSPPVCEDGQPYSSYLAHAEWCEKKECYDEMRVGGKKCAGPCEFCPEFDYSAPSCTNVDPLFTACGNWTDTQDALLDYYRKLNKGETSHSASSTRGMALLLTTILFAVQSIYFFYH